MGAAAEGAAAAPAFAAAVQRRWSGWTAPLRRTIVARRPSAKVGVARS